MSPPDRKRRQAAWPLAAARANGRWRRPLSRVFGVDRGTCVDRHYIEAFLRAHRADVRGRVLEVGDLRYTRLFGGADVTSADVLHVRDHPDATVVGDLASGRGIPTSAYDCLIVTQTLHVIYDIHGAVAHLRAALRPGGVVLATLPGISQISRWDLERWGDYWRLTSRAARLLFEEAFAPEDVDVRAYGNVLAAAAFLYGVTVEELTAADLDDVDPDYETLVGVRAVRPA